MHDPLKRFSIEEVTKFLRSSAVPQVPDKKNAAMQAVINTNTDPSSSDPADIWNNMMKGEDEKSLLEMIRRFKGSSLKDSHLLIGKPIKCHGSSGFGTYDASITKVDVGKGWLEVLWTNEQYTSWKTAKLCWME